MLRSGENVREQGESGKEGGRNERRSEKSRPGIMEEKGKGMTMVKDMSSVEFAAKVQLALEMDLSWLLLEDATVPPQELWDELDGKVIPREALGMALLNEADRKWMSNQPTVGLKPSLAIAYLMMSELEPWHAMGKRIDEQRNDYGREPAMNWMLASALGVSKKVGVDIWELRRWVRECAKESGHGVIPPLGSHHGQRLIVAVDGLWANTAEESKKDR